MKIQKLVMRHFGKFSNQTIELDEGINLVFGENESGKSTVHSFIKSMLFGLERGRGRAAAKDMFSQYEPWENESLYAGAMTFESGGKRFQIQRNFDKFHKKSDLFCLEDGEHLSVEDGDLEAILDGLTESVYDNTISVSQMKVYPDKVLTQELKNYAMNYYLSGDGELDLAATFQYLKEKRKGLDKSIRDGFQEKQLKRERIEQEASFVWRDVHKLGEEQDRLKEEIEYQKERCKQPEELENRGIIDELRPDKWRIHPLEILGCILGVVLTVFIITKPWNYLVAIVLVILSSIYTWNRMKVGKKTKRGFQEENEEEEILKRLCWEQERGFEELREKQIQYNNLREQLEELHEIDASFWELERQREAIDLAEKKLNEISKDMQKQTRIQMNEKLSGIISNLTDGKYRQLFLEEDMKIFLMDKEKRVPLENVSRGTIEQIYLALRLSAAEMLKEEELPVILDDTFAFYDDMRLKRTLQWLNDNRKQVIIFTCQKREEDLLKQCGITYHKIEL